MEKGKHPLFSCRIILLPSRKMCDHREDLFSVGHLSQADFLQTQGHISICDHCQLKDCRFSSEWLVAPASSTEPYSTHRGITEYDWQT